MLIRAARALSVSKVRVVEVVAVRSVVLEEKGAPEEDEDLNDC